MLDVIKKGNTIYVCGNGGSAAIANHYVCDFLKYFRQRSNFIPKIISLSNSIETITAIANDIDYKYIFNVCVCTHIYIYIYAIKSIDASIIPP